MMGYVFYCALGVIWVSDLRTPDHCRPVGQVYELRAFRNPPSESDGQDKQSRIVLPLTNHLRLGQRSSPRIHSRQASVTRPGLTTATGALDRSLCSLPVSIIEYEKTSESWPPPPPQSRAGPHTVCVSLFYVIDTGSARSRGP